MFMLASSDGRIDEGERKMLLDMGQRCGLSGTDMSQIINNPASVDMAAPKNLEEGLKQLIELVDLMICDNEISEKEYNYLLKILPELHVPPNASEQVLNMVIDEAIKVHQQQHLLRNDVLLDQIYKVIEMTG